MAMNSKIEEISMSGLFEKSLRNYPFEEFYRIAKDNSEGRIWVIGGFVYKNIIKQLYGTPFEEEPIDIDFLSEGHAREIYPPKGEGWKLGRTSVGDLSVVKEGKYRLDLNGLINFHSITSRKLDPRIENFYTGTPLNIQSISYDCERGVVEGEVGINAIRKKVVKFNNLEELRWEAKRLSKLKKSDVSPDDLIKAKAEELGFEYRLPTLRSRFYMTHI